MKKVLYAICIILVCFCFGACNEKNIQTKDEKPLKIATDSPHWQKIVSENEIKIGVSSLDDSFCNELIDAFSKELNIPVKKILIDKNEGFGGMLKEEAIDMYWGLYPKEAQDSFDYSFSSPYLTTTADLLVHKNFSDEIDKKEMTVGVIENSAEYFLVKGNYEKVKTFYNEQSLLYALSSKSIDCAMINNRSYEKLSQDFSDNIKIKDTMMYNLVIAFKDGYADLATEVDKTFAKVKASGIASEICEKWYGKDLISK